MESKKTFKALGTALLFMAPFAVLYTLFTIWPVFQGAFVSTHDWGLMGSRGSVGFENYARAFGDQHFWGALRNTALFTVITVPLLMVTAISLALLANRDTKLKKLARSSFYIPSVLSVTVISYIALYMAAPHTGFINQLLRDLECLPWGSAARLGDI